MVDKSSKTITVYEVLSAGFVKVPVNGVTSFQPELRDTKTVYITIICFDNLGDQKIIATNLPHGPSHSVIITKGGGVVDAADGMKWTDKNGIYHKVNCLVCLGVKSNCTAFNIRHDNISEFKLMIKHNIQKNPENGRTKYEDMCI